ncbi:MAG: TonB-dependent receptor [Thermoanaerobaculia bacterium]
MKRFVQTFLLLCAVGALVSTPLGAVTTGTIFGSVTDEQGHGLHGVSVTISSKALQGLRSMTTRERGEYIFSLLPPGTYHADFTASGLQAVSQSNIIVSLDQETKVNVSMKVAKVSESLNVVGDSEVIDPTQTGIQQNFKTDYLEYSSVGQGNRSYQSAILQAPGVADSGDGNPQIFGANEGQNSYLIDGLNTTDPVTHTFELNFGFDAIQEISVMSSFDAEYGKAVGGIINVVTKSGGNDVAGSFDIRYRNEHFSQNGDHFKKSDRPYERVNPEATLGGPIVKDKMWFFLDAQRNINETQYQDLFGFKPLRSDDFGWNLFGKLTATAVPNQTTSFRYTNSYADFPSTDSSPSFVEPAAATDQYQKVQIYNLSHDAVFNANWLANIQAGIDDSYLIAQPHSGNRDLTGVYDLVTGISSVNGSNFQKSDRNRLDVMGSTTFLFAAAGDHAVKVGFDIEKTTFREVNNATGTPFDPSLCSPDFYQPAGATCGALDYRAQGDPYLYIVQTNLPITEFKGHGQSYYIQDEWKPMSRLTANIGLRYDQVHFTGGSTDKTLNRFQPRLGIAYDAFNDSSLVFHAQAGQFMDDNALTLPAYLNKIGAVSSEFLFNPDSGGYDLVAVFGGPSGNQIDPSLRATYTEEVNVGVEKRVFTNSSVGVTGIYRHNKNIFEDSCKVPPYDCSEDPTYWLTNKPGGMDLLKSQYRALVFKFEGRPTQNSNVLLSYTLAKSQGSVEYTQNQSYDFDVYPVHFVNRYGYLSDDARHRVKLSGFYRFPWQITAGTTFYWDSGVPYTVYQPSPDPAFYGNEYLEPRGSRRLPHYYEWDLQLQKGFDLGPVHASVIASILNLLNTEIPIARDGSVGSEGTVADPTNSDFNKTTVWQTPRRFEIGARVTF